DGAEGRGADHCARRQDGTGPLQLSGLRVPVARSGRRLRNRLKAHDVERRGILRPPSRSAFDDRSRSIHFAAKDGTVELSRFGKQVYGVATGSARLDQQKLRLEAEPKTVAFRPAHARLPFLDSA